MVIDKILVGDLDAPREQRHTATRIFARLINEHSMTNISYPVVRAYVAKRKPEISPSIAATSHGRTGTALTGGRRRICTAGFIRCAGGLGGPR